MIGANEYAQLFSTGQHGRLYLVSGEHARGKTFRIFVLPEGERAIPNGPPNAPLNKGAIEVFGVTEGNPGWTETYGWLHRGKWEEDFAELVADRKREIADVKAARKSEADASAKREANRAADLLGAYQ